MEKNIKCNVKRSVILFLLGVGILGICFFFGFYDFRRFVDDDSLFNIDIFYYFMKAFMVFGFLFLGFCMLILLRNLFFYRNNIIEFGKDYMIDKSSYTSAGKIQYSEIEDVYIKNMWLCIKLHNEEKFLKRQNFLKRLFMRGNKRMGFEYITISDQFLETNVFEIKKILKENLNH